MSVYLVIDQSTSATKAILYDTDGNPLGEATAEHRQHYPQPGWVEHDLDEIMDNTVQVCREVMETTGRRDVIAISLTNQRETIAFWGRETGVPLRRAIVWQDRRGVAVCDQLNREGRGPEVWRKTGLPIDAYFSASKINWAIREDPAVREAASSGQMCIGTIDTYLVFQLTGGKVFATDHTNASRTLLMDLRDGQWDDQLLDLFAVPRTALPEIRSSFTGFGTTQLAGLLDVPVPIMGVMGDSHASLLAHGGVLPGDAKATFGTGTSVMLNIGQQIPGKAAAGRQPVALAWRFRDQNTYALEGLINYSAATLKWLKDQLGLLKDAAESEAIAASLDSNEGVYLVPAFSGLNLPVSAPGARALICGLTARSDRRHLIRAALESIAYQIADCRDSLESVGGVAITSLNADGGPTRNAWLMKFCADILGIPLAADRHAALSPRGALYAGWLAEGKLTSPEAIKELPRSTRCFTPELSPELRKSWQDGWRKAIHQTLSTDTSSRIPPG